MLLGREWAHSQWVFISLIGLGCVGAFLLLKCRWGYLVSLGAAFCGLFVAACLVHGIEQDGAVLLDFGERSAVELKGLRRLSPRGDLNRLLVEDERGARWLLEDPQGVVPGQRALVLCCRRAVLSPVHPWDFDEAQYLKSRGVDGVLVSIKTLRADVWIGYKAQLFGAMDEVRQRVRSRIWPQSSSVSQGAGLLLGLAMGDKSSMSWEVRKAFSGLGLAHLTAVSGFHVGLVLLFFSSLVRSLGVNRRWSGLLSLPLVWAYAIVCGASPSALRASGMATLASVMLALGRKPDGMVGLAILGMVMLAKHPDLVWDLRARLSFLATLGILLWFHTRTKRPSNMSVMVAIPLCATVFTAPVAWPAFGQLPVGFLPANVLMTPIVPILSLLVVLLIVLPEAISAVFSPWVLFLADGAVQLVVWGHQLLPALDLVPNRCVLTLAGTCLAFFYGLGLCWRFRGYRSLALAACFFVLRLGWMDWVRPRFHAFSDGEIVVHSSTGAAVYGSRTCGNSGELKWKTRTLLERVSMGPPLPVIESIGGRLAWSEVALVAKSPAHASIWLSSSRSPCESLGPHTLPRRPCP